MKRIALAAALLVSGIASPSDAQLRMPRLPVIFPLRQAPAPGTPGAPPPAFVSPGAMQADLVVKSGSDTV